MRSAGRCLIALACLVSALVAGARQVFALGLSSNNPIVDQVLAPGDAVQGTIELVSSTDRPIHLKVYVEDWQYTPAGDGNKQFAPPGTLQRSASTWITFFPRELDVPARGQVLVDYSIRVPKDPSLSGGYYSVLFFESEVNEPAGEGKDSVTVKYAARLGSLFNITIKGTAQRQAQLTVESVSPPSRSLPLRVHGAISNGGNVRLTCDGSFHVLSSANLVAARGELPRRYLWPGVKAPVDLEWPGSLDPGAYTVVLTYDCGENLILVEEASATVR